MKDIPPDVSLFMAQMGRRGGLIGGRVRAAKLSKEVRVLIAKKAANTRWSGGLVMEKSKVLSSSELMAKAEKAVATGCKLVASSDYIDVIKHLREDKGFTWRQVAVWFREQGIPLSKASLSSAYYSARDQEEMRNALKVQPLR